LKTLCLIKIPSNLKGIREWRSLALKTGFNQVKYGTIAVPTYPMGQIGFFVCHKTALLGGNVIDNKEMKDNDHNLNNNLEDDGNSVDVDKLKEMFKSMIHGDTKYYHARVHRR